MDRTLPKRAALLVAIVFSFAIACEVGAHTQDDAMADYDRLKASAVRIQADSKNGSGTVIASRQRKDGMWEIDILTAKHVLAQPKVKQEDTGLAIAITVTWWFFQNPSFEPVEFSQSGKILAVSTKYDLALVRMESRSKFPTVAAVGTIPARRGDRVFAVGSPFGIEPVVTRGFVSILYHDVPGDDERYLIADAPVWFGNSGGGLHNQNYEIVGVTAAMLGGVSHIALFSHLESILEFLNSPR